MTMFKGIWYGVRGMSLLVVLCVLFVGALTVSCVLRLALGSGFPEAAGRLHLGA